MQVPYPVFPLHVCLPTVLALQESVFNVYLITHTILHGLSSTVRAQMPALHGLADALALLDMLQSFAALAATASPVQPYSTSPLYPTVVRACMHPPCDLKCLRRRLYTCARWRCRHADV